ncbi:hypothetical protein MTO96_018638 [Rhipicephalus appendiculatus]
MRMAESMLPLDLRHYGAMTHAWCVSQRGESHLTFSSPRPVCWWSPPSASSANCTARESLSYPRTLRTAHANAQSSRPPPTLGHGPDLKRATLRRTPRPAGSSPPHDAYLQSPLSWQSKRWCATRRRSGCATLS